MSKVSPVPAEVNIKPTRTSARARERWVNRPYFTSMTGTRSINKGKSMPTIEIKIANPDRPAVEWANVSSYADEERLTHRDQRHA